MSTQPATGARLARVRALLAKAESTDFPEEAELLVAKAHELMERYAIDDALLAATAEGRRPPPVEVKEVVVQGPYARARAALLGAAARSTYCRLLIGPSLGPDLRCTLIGRVDDLDHVRSVYAILDAQATRSLLAARDPSGRPRAFRHAFLLAYAARVGQRLDDARSAARSSVDREASTAVALASVDRWAEVDAAMKAAFPRLRTVRASASSGVGLASGRAAADRASLGHSMVAGRHALPEASR